MSFLDTEHKRKSMTITVILYSLLLLLLFFVGMTYLDPAPENGIAVNFGTTDTGTGNIQPTEAIKSAPKVTTPTPTPQPKTEVKEDVVTQDTEDAPVIKKEEEKVVKTETPVKKEAQQRGRGRALPLLVLVVMEIMSPLHSLLMSMSWSR